MPWTWCICFECELHTVSRMTTIALCPQGHFPVKICATASIYRIQAPDFHSEVFRPTLPRWISCLLLYFFYQLLQIIIVWVLAVDGFYIWSCYWKQELISQHLTWPKNLTGIFSFDVKCNFTMTQRFQFFCNEIDRLIITAIYYADFTSREPYCCFNNFCCVIWIALPVEVV